MPWWVPNWKSIFVREGTPMSRGQRAILGQSSVTTLTTCLPRSHWNSTLFTRPSSPTWSQNMGGQTCHKLGRYSETNSTTIIIQTIEIPQRIHILKANCCIRFTINPSSCQLLDKPIEQKPFWRVIGLLKTHHRRCTQHANKSHTIKKHSGSFVSNLTILKTEEHCLCMIKFNWVG